MFQSTPTYLKHSYLNTLFANLISHDEIDKALKVLLDEVKDTDAKNELILHKRKWRSTKKEKRLGTVSRDKLEAERTRLNQALLDFLLEF